MCPFFNVLPFTIIFFQMLNLQNCSCSELLASIVLLNILLFSIVFFRVVFSRVVHFQILPVQNCLFSLVPSYICLFSDFFFPQLSFPRLSPFRNCHVAVFFLIVIFQNCRCSYLSFSEPSFSDLPCFGFSLFRFLLYSTVLFQMFPF